MTQAIVLRAREILPADSEAAMRARGPDERFERVVEAAILLSGLAFESGEFSLVHSLVAQDLIAAMRGLDALA